MIEPRRLRSGALPFSLSRSFGRGTTRTGPLTPMCSAPRRPHAPTGLPLCAYYRNAELGKKLGEVSIDHSARGEDEVLLMGGKFHRYDADGNGSLDREEMRELLLSMGKVRAGQTT